MHKEFNEFKHLCCSGRSLRPLPLSFKHDEKYGRGNNNSLKRKHCHLTQTHPSSNLQILIYCHKRKFDKSHFEKRQPGSKFDKVRCNAFMDERMVDEVRQKKKNSICIGKIKDSNSCWDMSHTYLWWMSFAVFIICKLPVTFRVRHSMWLCPCRLLFPCERNEGYLYWRTGGALGQGAVGYYLTEMSTFYPNQVYWLSARGICLVGIKVRPCMPY